MKRFRPRVIKKVLGGSAFKRLSSYNYYTAKAYLNFLHYTKPLDRPPIIVYQMGKVGSTSVVKSLKALRLDMPVYHVHYLTPQGIARAEQVFKDDFPKSRHVGRTVLHSQYLRRYLNKGWCDHRWKVITLVREPIARNVSSFFEILDLELQYGYQDKIKTRPVETIVKELEYLFFNRFDQHEFPLTWLDVELKPVLGIDVFASDFPKETGYKIYHTPQVDLLLLRLESLNQCAAAAFKEFLNLDNFSLIQANVGTLKGYNTAYKTFLNILRLPDSYIDKMYTSRFARHFYTEVEIETFRARWNNQPSSPPFAP